MRGLISGPSLCLRFGRTEDEQTRLPPPICSAGALTRCCPDGPQVIRRRARKAEREGAKNGIERQPHPHHPRRQPCATGVDRRRDASQGGGRALRRAGARRGHSPKRRGGGAPPGRGRHRHPQRRRAGEGELLPLPQRPPHRPDPDPPIAEARPAEHVLERLTGFAALDEGLEFLRSTRLPG